MKEDRTKSHSQKRRGVERGKVGLKKRTLFTKKKNILRWNSRKEITLTLFGEEVREGDR